MLKFVAVWQGDAVAAARAAGYRNPVTDAYRLMDNPTVMTEIKRKQRAIAEESGRRIGAQLNFDRSHVLNRLWEIAQIPPEETNKGLGSQVKAAEVLTAVFDAELKYIAELLPHLQGKTAAEIHCFIRNGHFPLQQHNPDDGPS
ncbi:MAG TPA: hypothetical protein VG649_06735 [Candidatus Angelobacter sp.]|nr:hypothetical protein [Candidatus Angelobacter sp.]